MELFRFSKPRSSRIPSTSPKSHKRVCIALLVTALASPFIAQAKGPACKVQAYDFSWSGQIAGFMVKGRFSFNANKIPHSGIIREEDLLAMDVFFYDPKGRLVKAYKNNHKKPVDDEGKPYLNFAFDTITEELLQDGTWKVDSDDARYPNGFMMGEGNPDLRSIPGSQSGIAFWSRPSDEKTPHLHIDDWADEFIDPDTSEPYPTAFSSHEDVAFPYQSTQQLMDKPGKVKVSPVATDVGAFGNKVKVRMARPSVKDWRDYRRCVRKAY